MSDLYSRLMDGIAMAQQGAQVKKRRTLADLASQAYGADPDAQRGYVQQAIGVDPSAGFQLGQSLGTDRDQVQARLAQEAGIFAEAPDEQKAAMYPRLAAHAKQLGFPVPDAYDPRMLPMIQKIAMAGVGAGKSAELQTFDAMTQGLPADEVMAARRIRLGLDPRAAVVQPGQYDSSRGAFVSNPFYGGSQQAPISTDGQPNADAIMGDVAAKATAYGERLRASGVPADQIAGLQDDYYNALVSGVQQRGVDVTPIPQPQASGSRAIPVEGLPPKPEAVKDTFAPLTSDEVAQLGLPPGTFAQRNTVTGEINFGPAGVQGPKPMSEYQRQQLQMKSGKAKAALSGTVTDLDRMGAAVRKVMNSPGLDRITGIMGALPNIPGSDAANAEADLDALKSQIAFAVLAKMRAMSPTGGALGSVSDAEGKRLEANLAALDKAQSADQMRARLQDILDYIESSKGNLRGAYDEQFGEQGGAAQPATTSGSDDARRKALLDKY